MRINKYLAQATGMSRRAADQAIGQGSVLINGHQPTPGQDVTPSDEVTCNGKRLRVQAIRTIMLNKPAGYVVSRDGQGSHTVYDLLPAELHSLKPVGRLDKYSSGLLLLTNDGSLANQLTHPRYAKAKVYEVSLSQPLQPLHRQMIQDRGIRLDDGPSQFGLERMEDGNDTKWRIRMHEGRNRQIRRTFLALGYGISSLHRTHFGSYSLGQLKPGSWAKAATSIAISSPLV